MIRGRSTAGYDASGDEQHGNSYGHDGSNHSHSLDIGGLNVRLEGARNDLSALNPPNETYRQRAPSRRSGAPELPEGAGRASLRSRPVVRLALVGPTLFHERGSEKPFGCRLGSQGERSFNWVNQDGTPLESKPVSVTAWAKVGEVPARGRGGYTSYSQFVLGPPS